VGINHKQYGVTSYGLTVCLEKVLQFLGFQPDIKPFTVKMAGGPDGDVAGNEIRLLHEKYPKTAKLVSLIDVSGLIHDPEGIDLAICTELFRQGKSIRFYPPEKLSSAGFLLDKEKHRDGKMLLWKKATETWIAESEAAELLRTHVHRTYADVFIPAGGRPRTLSGREVLEYIDRDGKPTSKAIVEGANLYLSQEAREFLEARGVLIIKDSTANKGGVICSSFEILAELALTEEEFIRAKDSLVKEILERIKTCSEEEISLILRIHKKTGRPCSLISDELSDEINNLAAAALESLNSHPLTSRDQEVLFSYALPFLRKHYGDKLLEKVPDSHKKAICATHRATHKVYLANTHNSC
jgi:glutamate dehydrogenase